MVIGVVVATAGYYLVIDGTPAELGCTTLGGYGSQSVPVTMLKTDSMTSFAGFLAVLKTSPIWFLPTMVAIGLLLGLVLLIETFTTLTDSKDKTPMLLWTYHINAMVVVNAVAGLLGLSCASISASRTNALIDSHGSSRISVLAHGIVILLITLFLSSWLALLPRLAVAVALMLVAIQMLDSDMVHQVWSRGFHGKAEPSERHDTWIFISVSLLSVAIGSLLIVEGFGFSGGPVIAFVFGLASLNVTRLIVRKSSA